MLNLLAGPGVPRYTGLAGVLAFFYTPIMNKKQTKSNKIINKNQKHIKEEIKEKEKEVP